MLGLSENEKANLSKFYSLKFAYESYFSSIVSNLISYLINY